MKTWSTTWIMMVGVLLGSVAGVSAQIEIEARAVGAELELGGTPAFSGSDTGTHTAGPNESFTATAPATQIPAAPLLEGVTTESTVEGTSIGGDTCTVTPVDSPAFEVPAPCVNSSAGEATVTLLPGAADVFVASNGSHVALFCNDEGVLELSTSSVANAVSAPGQDFAAGSSDDTTVAAEDLPIIRLNHREAVNGGIQMTAVKIQLVTASEVLELEASKSFARMTNSGCPGGEGCAVGGSKDAAFVTDQDGDFAADDGDRLRYDIEVEGLIGACTDLVVIDRIPLGTQIDQTSVQIGGLPAAPGAFTIGPCPAEAADVATICPNEASSGRTCLSIPIGDLAQGEQFSAGYEVDVVDVCEAVGDRICNAFVVPGDAGGFVSGALVEADKAQANCPVNGGGGPPPPVEFETTGGGCSVAPGSPTADRSVPFLALGVLLLAGTVLRKRR